jgi:hypothetical protein
MLGQLALALMADVAEATTTGTCSGCGQLKTLQRRPKPTRRAFCEECRRDGAPKKAAAKAYRKRISSGEIEAPESLANLAPHRRPPNTARPRAASARNATR